MELQWPLMLFTLFICLGAGTFAVQGVYAIVGKGSHVQKTSLIVSLAALVIGGAASFVHLEHWDRIFNGFGNLSSGITQELIAIVVFVLALALYFVVLSRSESNNVPRWCGIIAVVVSLALLVVMAHSYNMAARPIWNTILLWLYYLTHAALLGTISYTLMLALSKSDTYDGRGPRKYVLISAFAHALSVISYVAYFSIARNAFTSVGHYSDPTHPALATIDPMSTFSSILIGENALLFWGGVVVIGLVVPIVLALLSKGVSRKTIVAMSIGGIGAALIGGICFRAILYVLGFSVFVFY